MGYPPPNRNAPMDDMLSARPAAPYADAPVQRQRRTGRLVALCALAIVLLGAAGYGAVHVTHRHAAATIVTSSAPAALPSGDPIASQRTDSAPLTAAEVFPAATIASSAGGGSYTVVKSQALDACGSIATGKIADLLTSLGCTQAVRATLTSPDGAYVITTGIANLPDAAAAANARTAIKPLVEAGDSRFNGFDAGGKTTVIIQAKSQASWDSRGHYLVYAVIALENGGSISPTDDHTPLIISDLLEKYLSTSIIGAREKK